MTQADGAAQHHSDAVGPAGGQGLGHALQGAGVGRLSVEIDLAAKAAHGLSLYCESSVHK